MASAFLTEAEARSARACVPSSSAGGVSSSLDDLVDNTSTSTHHREAEREEEATTLEARLQYIATRVLQGYMLSEEEKEVLRRASELEE